MNRKLEAPFRAKAGAIDELWRYYKGGLINTVFGYSVFAILIFFGLEIYLAQIIGQILGITFNYMMFSRYVFRGTKPALLSYAVAYLVNYLFSLIVLASLHQIVSSPYIAGLLSIVVVSLINYFILKRFVFKSSAPA